MTMKTMRHRLLTLCLLSAAICSAEIIRIPTANTQIVMSVGDDGQLLFHHYSKKFDGIEPFLSASYNIQSSSGTGYPNQAYPPYGGHLTVLPALKLTMADGVQTTQLQVARVLRQITPDPNVRIMDITLTDPLYDISLTLHLTAYEAEDVITESVSLTNNMPTPVYVENIASSYLPLMADSYWLTHFHGAWASEMHLTEEQLTAGIKSVESRRGVQTAQTASPSFLISLDGPAREDSGEVYGGSLAWSGNHKTTFEVDECGQLNVLPQINDFASTYTLDPGQTLTTPQMVWTYSDRGRGQVSRNLHDWVRRYGLMHGTELRPIVLNSWEGAYFNFSEHTLHEMIDHAADIGVEMFVLDDGWFGNGDYARNSDRSGLGDWQANSAKLPCGIDSLARYARSKGLKFGLWIEPEMVNPNSRLAHEHPEWVVQSGSRQQLTQRNQWVLDLSNPQVQDFIVATFDSIMALSPAIDYIKWDSNRFITDFGSLHLPPDRQSHFWIDYAKGLHSVYERIRDRHHFVMMQLCSSGGARLDMDALQYHDEFWTSDNTNAADRIRLQHAANIFYPAMATGAHVSSSPNHQTGTSAPLKYRFDIAMSGRLGLELNPKTLAGRDRDFAREAIATYKKIRPTVQLGDLYRLKNPEERLGWVSNMYVAKDGHEAVLFAYSNEYHPRTTRFTTRLKGLHPDRQYRVTELNKAGSGAFPLDGRTFPGDYLMNVGLPLRINNPHDSAVLLIADVTEKQ